MSFDGAFPVKQPDDTYRVPDNDPAMAKAVWGTVQYWAQVYGLLEVRTAFRARLMEEFRFMLFVEEGGCNFLIFPEKAAMTVRDRFLRERVGAAERDGYKIN